MVMTSLYRALVASGGYAVIPVEPCVFCEIVAGRSPAEIVCTWPDATAFISLDPVTPGHTLVVPNEHIADAVERPGATAMVMQRAAELASEYQYSNILTNTGTPAHQSVFHLHIHVIPRSADDQLMLPWGTTGDPHAPHWCRVAERLQRQIDVLVDQRAGTA
jgi:histidine triad (HIT) family protein